MSLDFKHGHSGYANHGCKCDICTMAVKEYRKKPKHTKTSILGNTELNIGKPYHPERESIISKIVNVKFLEIKNGKRITRKRWQNIEAILM